MYFMEWWPDTYDTYAWRVEMETTSLDLLGISGNSSYNPGATLRVCVC
jgi:hypothetical protein